MDLWLKAQMLGNSSVGERDKFRNPFVSMERRIYLNWRNYPTFSGGYSGQNHVPKWEFALEEIRSGRISESCVIVAGRFGEAKRRPRLSSAKILYRLSSGGSPQSFQQAPMAPEI
ncbi:unnamed protein product [Victoria cruziana]